jgi:hypothetical protein
MSVGEFATFAGEQVELLSPDLNHTTAGGSTWETLHALQLAL